MGIDGMAGVGDVVDRLGDPVSAAEIAAFMARLAVGSPAGGDGERIERIGALEGLKAAAAAAQACDVVAFAESQLDDQAVRGVRARQRGAGIASQIGLACRASPYRGGRMLATARALLSDLPRTWEALSRGETSEYRATVVARETASLDSAQRRRVDEELGPRLCGLGDRRVEAEARGWACRLDPAAAVQRASRAHSERRVTCRPAPETMTYLSGLLPVCDGVAVYAALDAAAKAAAAAGDSRSRGQVMADTLVERVTGASAGVHPVEISIVMTDRALLGGGDEPAQVPGYGPVPAKVARQWILAVLDLDTEHTQEAADGEGGDGERAVQVWTGEVAKRRRARRHERGRVWLRRLYASPDGRHLVAMDSRRRTFPRLLRRLIEFRDRTCATPYCEAPIRHIDHIEPARRQGATSYTNGRGTCARCNHAKEAPGWSATVQDTTTTTTRARCETRSAGETGALDETRTAVAAPWNTADATDPADHTERADRAVQAVRVVTLTTPTGHSYQSHPPQVHYAERMATSGQGGPPREDRPSRHGESCSGGEPGQRRAG